MNEPVVPEYVWDLLHLAMGFSVGLIIGFIVGVWIMRRVIQRLLSTVSQVCSRPKTPFPEEEKVMEALEGISKSLPKKTRTQWD